MGTSMLDLYELASAWTAARVAGAAARLDAPTPCDDWDVRTLLDHMLDTQRYFLGVARGDRPPSGHRAGADPVLLDRPTRRLTCWSTGRSRPGPVGRRLAGRST